MHQSNFQSGFFSRSFFFRNALKVLPDINVFSFQYKMKLSAQIMLSLKKRISFSFKEDFFLLEDLKKPLLDKEVPMRLVYSTKPSITKAKLF